MLNPKTLMIATCLAALPWVATSSFAAPPKQDQASKKKSSDAAAKTAKQEQEQAMTQLRASVLSSALGIHAADEAASVMYQLADADPTHGVDLHTAAEFADKAIGTAKTSAKQLGNNSQLTAQQRVDARSAIDHLDEAQKTLTAIKRRSGVMEGYYDKQGAQDIGQDTIQLHGHLEHASQALDSVAKGHRLSTNLSFPAQPVANK